MPEDQNHLALSRPTHPSAEALYDCLTLADWRALAFLASEHVNCRPPSGDQSQRLLRLGLIMPPGFHVTAAGYALLLHWHRRHIKPWWRTLLLPPEQRTHEMVMRVMIDFCGFQKPPASRRILDWITGYPAGSAKSVAPAKACKAGTV
ncbi:MAG: hypothetical protein WCF85_22500 [Rhodospirillaceae bacterium]